MTPKEKPIGEHRIVPVTFRDIELAPHGAHELCSVDFDEDGRVSDVVFICQEVVGNAMLKVYLNGSKVSEFPYVTGKVKLPIGSVVVKNGDEVSVLIETEGGAEIIGCGASYTFWADQ